MFWGAFVIGIVVGACAVAVGWCCFRDVEERPREDVWGAGFDIGYECGWEDRAEREPRPRRAQHSLELEQAMAEFPEWRRGPGGEA